MDRIALAVDSRGTLADFFSIAEILIYEKKDDWAIVDRFQNAGDWSRESTGEVRNKANSIGETLIRKDCNILVGKEIIGIPYHALCRIGVEVFEADEISNKLFEEIYEDFIMEKVEIVEEAILPEPIPVDDEGNYYLNFSMASRCHPQISSKKMLLPFLNNDLYYSLAIRSDHMMPWLEEYVKTHNLSMEVKRENESTHVLITHNPCGFQKKIKVRGEWFIPKHTQMDCRTRNKEEVTIYKTGEIKSIYLESQQEINAPVGRLKAEMVTFYQSGRYHRIFPAYGQISGYWSVEEEGKQVPVSSIIIRGQKIEGKISCFCFYESGAIKSLTLWPGESIPIMTPSGELKARYGISFYEDGSLESIEPDIPATVTYKKNKFLAYDNHSIGIHGDKNSLVYGKNGEVKALKTTMTAIVLWIGDQCIRVRPEQRISQADIEKMELIPLKIEFKNETIKITDSDGMVQEFDLSRYELKTEPIVENLKFFGACKDCESCNQCEH